VLGELARYFSRGCPGGEWECAHGAMGKRALNGCSMKEVLDSRGVKAGAVQVRFKRHVRDGCRGLLRIHEVLEEHAEKEKVN